VAEWIRAWALNPDEAKRLAPQFHDYFMSKVHPRAVRAVREFGDEVRRIEGMPAADQTLANVRWKAETPSLKERWQGQGKGAFFETTGKDRVIAALLDRVHPILKGARAAQRLRGTTHLPPELDPEVLLRTYEGEDLRLLRILGLTESGPSGPVTARNEPVPGLEGGFRRVLDAFDQSSPAALERDMRDAAAYMISQRTLWETEHTRTAAAKALQKPVRSPEAVGAAEQKAVSGAGHGLHSDRNRAIATLKELQRDKARLPGSGGGALPPDPGRREAVPPLGRLAPRLRGGEGPAVRGRRRGHPEGQPALRRHAPGHREPGRGAPARQAGTAGV
jgi:hypothetical protein